jgi:hypothetical protein
MVSVMFSGSTVAVYSRYEYRVESMTSGSLIKSSLVFIVLLFAMPALAQNQPIYFPLGQLTNLATSSCSSPPGAVSGAQCYTASVVCPDTDDDTVYLAVRQVSNSIGFAVLQGGRPGTFFWGNSSDGPFAVQDNRDGYSTVQIAWSSNFNWLIASPTGVYPQNTMIAACREATVLKYIHDTYDPDGAIPFGVQASSEGTGAMLYAMIDYNLATLVKTAMLAAATPVGDFLAGCTNPPNSTAIIGTNTLLTSPYNPCINRSSSIVLPAQSWADQWLRTHTCSAPPYEPDDLAKWEVTSLDNLRFGSRRIKTKFSVFWCPDGNSVPGLGNYFFQQLPTANITYDACGPANGGGSYCPATKGDTEQYWTGNGISPGPGFQEMYLRFEADMQS